MWGPHLITLHGTEGFRCITCARIANHRKARYALKTLPCSGRVGLTGPLQPHRPRFKWNKANETRWKRQGKGGHQVDRYNTTQHDGRWLCMRCGLHYVRFCDLRAKQCAGAPGNQAATKSVTDALAGGPLTRRKVHAFAKHPSGSRPGAPGARLPSDVLVFDPSVPMPPGPAIPQAQGGAPEGPRGAPQEQGPQGDHQGAESHVPAREQGLPAPRVEHEPKVAVRAHAPQGEALSEPAPEAVGLLPGSPGGGGRPEGSKVAQGIRAFLGLGPSQVPPGARQKAAKTSKAGKPARAKAKRTPRGSASRQSPGAVPGRPLREPRVP